MSEGPENLVLHLLREMRADFAEVKSDVQSLRSDVQSLRADVAGVKSDMHSLRADVASDLMTLRADVAAETKQTREQIVGLRRAVFEYHSSVVGHGMLIGELDARVRRIEQNLGLPPMDAH